MKKDSLIKRTQAGAGLLLLAAFLLVSCSKDRSAIAGRNLGTVVVDAAPGAFPLRIRTDVKWRACATDSWLQVGGQWMEADDVCRIDYASNESVVGDIRFARAGNVLFETADGLQVDTLLVLQRGAMPFLSLTASYEIPEEGGDCSLTLDTNLGDRQRAALSLHCETKWIHDLRLGADGRSILFSAEEGEGRSTVLYVEYTDVFGQVTTTSCTLNQ